MYDKSNRNVHPNLNNSYKIFNLYPIDIHRLKIHEFKFFILIHIIKQIKIKSVYIKENKRRKFYVNNVAYPPVPNTPSTKIYVQYRCIRHNSSCSFFIPTFDPILFSLFTKIISQSMLRCLP